MRHINPLTISVVNFDPVFKKLQTLQNRFISTDILVGFESFAHGSSCSRNLLVNTFNLYRVLDCWQMTAMFGDVNQLCLTHFNIMEVNIRKQ